MATGLAYALYSHNIKKFTLTGHIKSGLPPAQFPMFSANLYNVSSHEYNLTLTSKDIFSVSYSKRQKYLSQKCQKLLIIFGHKLGDGTCY